MSRWGSFWRGVGRPVGAVVIGVGLAMLLCTIRDALLLWMSSVQRVDEEGGRVWMGRVPTPPAAVPPPEPDGGPLLDGSVDLDAGDQPERDASEASPPPPGSAAASSVPSSPGSAPPASPEAPDAPGSAEAPEEPPPLWNIFPMLSDPDGEDRGDLAEQLLPSLGLRERGRKLPVRGVLPRGVAGLHVGMRALVPVFALALLAKWIPASFALVFLWVALAAAAAAGWSARDFLPDLFAGIVLLVERRVRPGTWVQGIGFAGEVETRGPRAARLRDAEGRILTVPNRKLLTGPLAVDTSARPKVDVVVRVPEGIEPAQARQAVRDAALLSPWRVLQDPPEVRRDGDDPQAWRVRARLLEPRFLRAFESTLADHVQESLWGANRAVGTDQRLGDGG